MLSRTFNFNSEILTEAVEKTFENGKTTLNLKSVIFDSSFGKAPIGVAVFRVQLDPGPRSRYGLINCQELTGLLGFQSMHDFAEAYKGRIDETQCWVSGDLSHIYNHIFILTN